MGKKYCSDCWFCTARLYRCAHPSNTYKEDTWSIPITHYKEKCEELNKDCNCPNYKNELLTTIGHMCYAFLGIAFVALVLYVVISVVC